MKKQNQTKLPSRRFQLCVDPLLAKHLKLNVGQHRRDHPGLRCARLRMDHAPNRERDPQMDGTSNSDNI